MSPRTQTQLIEIIAYESSFDKDRFGFTPIVVVTTSESSFDKNRFGFTPMDVVTTSDEPTENSRQVITEVRRYLLLDNKILPFKFNPDVGKFASDSYKLEFEMRMNVMNFKRSVVSLITNPDFELRHLKDSPLSLEKEDLTQEELFFI